MKNSPLTAVLLGMLGLSTLASVVLCLAYIFSSRELRGLQGQVAAINYRQSLVGALVNDMVEYSKKNQAIDPLLESVGAKTSKSSATNKPAGK